MGNAEAGVDFYWTKETLQGALQNIFSSSLPQGEALKSVTVLEDAASPPFTKVRVRYASPLSALLAVQACRTKKLSPQQVFSASAKDSSQWQFTSRQLQVTPLTTCPLLPASCAWRRSNPPKFRRLICRPGEPIELLQEERQSTRFVFTSGLVDTSKVDSSDLQASWWNNPRYVGEAVRRQVQQYDTSGKGVEIFVSIKKNKATHFCHIGMRSPADAKNLILGLQGTSMEWRLDWNTESASSLRIQSDRLFLDYAAITQRSSAKAMQRESGEKGVVVKGEKSRSECTSVTESVRMPGLVLIPDFVSQEEEKVLMAALTGPAAPWAPSQTNFSKSGAVKRRVQHYGYVFDYETADVLRDRSHPDADCPPLPGLPPEAMEEDERMESCFERCVSEGRGWDALACLLERTRQKEFDMEHNDNEAIRTGKKYHDINQITVNSYKPGEGIGSHVDTPSAFSDGLISISLNGGVVMEFKKHNSDVKTKKLVYLPPRSLLLMSGPARYEWEHMIVTRMTDTHDGVVIPRKLRVSLTMRTAIDLSGSPMPKVATRCFPPVWGAHNDNARDKSIAAESEKRALITPALERDNVQAVYDAIATQWHHTRGKRGVLWPGATQFLTQLPPGSVVADVGCGDGKYFPAIWEAGSYVIGTDISLPLLQQAAYRGGPSEDLRDGPSEPESRRVSEHRDHLRRRPAVAVADCMNIPMRTKSCDAAICIAVMHHLSTKERRLRCIAELARIVKVGGLINIQAWAMEQQQNSRRKFAGTDVFVPFNAQPKYLEKIDEALAASAPSQTFVGEKADEGNANKSMAQVFSEEYNAEFDEKKGLVVFKRYCHLYRVGELEEVVAQVDTVSLYQSGYENGNHFVILKVVK